MNDRTRSARYFAALAVVAVGASLFAAAFRALLGLAFGLAGATDVVGMSARLPVALRILLPALGGLCAGLIVRALRGGGGGVGGVMEAVVFGRGHLSIRRTLLTSLGSWLAIVSGGSIDREGPLIQFGGAFGGLAARIFRIDADRGRALMAAGTAAGFAAAYNTPLAAVLFMLEIVTGVVALDAIAGAVIATALGTTLTRAIVGGGPIYGRRVFAPASAAELVAYAVLGLVAAFGAWAFMQLLAKGEALVARSRLPQPWRAALGGLFVGILATRLPEVSGNGYEPLNAMLDGTLPIGLVAALLVAKAVATTSSVSSVSPGGVFTPTLFLGAALGVLPRRRRACFRQDARGTGCLCARRHGRDDRGVDTRPDDGGGARLRALGRLRDRAAAHARDRHRNAAFARASRRLDLRCRAPQARLRVGHDARWTKGAGEQA